MNTDNTLFNVYNCHAVTLATGAADVLVVSSHCAGHSFVRPHIETPQGIF